MDFLMSGFFGHLGGLWTSRLPSGVSRVRFSPPSVKQCKMRRNGIFPQPLGLARPRSNHPKGCLVLSVFKKNNSFIGAIPVGSSQSSFLRLLLTSQIARKASPKLPSLSERKIHGALFCSPLFVYFNYRPGHPPRMQEAGRTGHVLDRRPPC